MDKPMSIDLADTRYYTLLSLTQNCDFCQSTHAVQLPLHDNSFLLNSLDNYCRLISEYQTLKLFAQESRAIAGRTARCCCKLLIRRPIEFYNRIVQFPRHSTAFLLVFVCSESSVKK